MYILVRLLVALFVVVATPARAAAEDEAKRLAKAVYYALEEKPFDGAVAQKAIEDISRAEKLNPREAWVAIAQSRVALTMGYRSGDRFSIQSFAADAVKYADQHARQGVVLGPAESTAYSELARVQIILGNYRGAWETLNKAYEKDPRDFYPWYLRGVVSIRMRDIGRATAALDEAERRSILPYQRRVLLQERMRVARQSGDSALEERCYKDAVALDPRDAYAYGNYGSFLLGLKRYDEAIEYLEKALAITRYPLAAEQLRRARLLRDAATK